MAKKILKIALGIFTLFIVAAIAVPMFVKVDQYRPAIVKAINDKINGKIELGHLTLSLWGQIKIQIDGLKLTDSSNKEMISVKDAYFHVPFSSIFAGSPNLTLKMKSPSVALWKMPNGQWNLMGLMKAQPKSTEKESSSSIALPALAIRSRLSIELLQANVDVEDRSTGMKTKLKDFDLSLQEISLSRPIHYSVKAKIEASQAQAQGGAMTVEGPFEIKGVFEPKFSDATLDSFATDMTADFSSLSIHKPGVFHKKSGTPVKIEAKASGDPTRITVEKFEFQLQSLVLNAKGKLERASEMVSFDASTNEVDLAKLSDLMEKGGELNGKFSMKGHIEGPTSKLGFAGEVKLDGMTYKSPMMKNAAKIDAYVKAKLEEVETIRVSINAPGTDLKLSGSIKNVMANPILALKIDSNEMDLNRLIDLPDPKAKKKEEAAAPSGEGSKSQGASGKNPPSEDLDASFDALRKNERASKLSGSIDVNFKSIQVYDIKINAITMMTKIQSLSASIEPLKLQIWDGSIQGSMKTDLKPARPTYSFQTSVNGLDLKKAVESQMALFKNTLIGKVNLSVKGSGSSFVSTRATPALNLQGNFKVADAVFATIDIGKMVTEAVNGSIAKVSDKIPGLKGKSIKALPNSTSKYQYISSSFSMSNGTFRAPDFAGKAIPNQGIDVEGATSVNLVTEDVDAKWKLIDTYNLTKAKDISVDIGGQKVDSILVEKGKALVLPVTVGCKMKAPCMNYSEAPASLAKVALGNATGAAKSKVKQEVQQKVLEKAPEPVKNLLKKLPGGLFGN